MKYLKLLEFPSNLKFIQFVNGADMWFNRQDRNFPWYPMRLIEDDEGIESGADIGFQNHQL
jgi:hypothetical protein